LVQSKISVVGHSTEESAGIIQTEGDTNFFLNNQPDALITPILFCYKTLHVSGIFSAHHQEFSTVHSALVSCRFLMTGYKQRQDGTAVVSGHQKHA